MKNKKVWQMEVSKLKESILPKLTDLRNKMVLLRQSHLLSLLTPKLSNLLSIAMRKRKKWRFTEGTWGAMRLNTWGTSKNMADHSLKFLLKDMSATYRRRIQCCIKGCE
jgi:hypothetical protein